MKKDYPFSNYALKEKELAKESAVLLNDLLAVMDRRVSVSSFEKKYKVDSRQLEEFIDSLDVMSLNRPLPLKEKKLVLESMRSILRKEDASGAVAEKAVSKLYAYKAIQPLLDDDDIEEIMVNGFGKSVFIYHRKQGICKTNLVLDEPTLKGLVSQTGANPILQFDDVRLVDGSRANVTFPPAVSSATLTIRKFKEEPLSVISLIERGTLSVELAAFLWTAFEGLGVFPLNLMIAGSTAAGKTTMLNALTSFIPPSERVVSIEDTPELNLYGNENWVPLLTTPKSEPQDLLKNALRMRPDRLIVGDVRGGEAETLFTAMNTGHRGASGTLHANNDRDALTRLENAPMNVPRALLPLCDIMIIQHRFVDRRKGLVRRVVQVSEVSRTEEIIALNEIFHWNPMDDSIERTQTPSAAIEKLSKGTHRPIPDIMKEIEQRQQLLDYLLKKGISKQKEINDFMRQYYAKVLGEIPENK